MPSGKRGLVEAGVDVLTAARRLGVDLDSVCGGRGLCTRCQFVPVFGEFPKHQLTSLANHVSPKSSLEIAKERRLTRNGELRRLGCQAIIQGDLLVEVPEDSQVFAPVVRKDLPHRETAIAHNIRRINIKVAVGDDPCSGSDLGNVLSALRKESGLTELDISSAALQALSGAVKQEHGQITVAVHDNRQIIGVWAGIADGLYGVAVDIGSTTLAVHLCSLEDGKVVKTAGSMNPQIRFGEDLMSRISYIQMNPGEQEKLTSILRAAIESLVTKCCSEADVAADLVVSCTVVGNSTMHHLFLGLDPSSLGMAPFRLTTSASHQHRASEVGLDAIPYSEVYTLPCIAGHIGADSAAVILAERPYERDQMSLIIDVGTNAEILLGNRDKLYACSSPTGPAFEGAQLSCGQRAAPGAIERVRIDPKSLAVRFRVVGVEQWSDEPGFFEAVASTGVTGICGSGIIEVVVELFLSGFLGANGLFAESRVENSHRFKQDGRTWIFVLHESEYGNVTISQNDVRQVQLAKAALYAGIKLLMHKADVSKVDRVAIAGAFGAHIDAMRAMILGMIPDCPLDSVKSIGNSASVGARIALLDHSARAEIERVVQKVVKVETALEPAFQSHFVQALPIPHETDQISAISDVIPAPQSSVARRRRRRLRLEAKS